MSQVVVRLTSVEKTTLLSLDPGLTLSAVIRVLLGDPAAPGRGGPPRGLHECGSVTVRISQELSDEIDRRADLDDYTRSDAARVMLGLSPLAKEKVFRVKNPMQIAGTFKLGRDMIRQSAVTLDELTEKFWIPVPTPVTRISKSLRHHLALLGIKPRTDEPPVVVMPGRQGQRSASLWLTDSEAKRLQEIAANEGVALVEFLRRAIFGEAKPLEERAELGEAA